MTSKQHHEAPFQPATAPQQGRWYQLTAEEEMRLLASRRGSDAPNMPMVVSQANDWEQRQVTKIVQSHGWEA